MNNIIEIIQDIVGENVVFKLKNPRIIGRDLQNNYKNTYSQFDSNSIIISPKNKIIESDQKVIPNNHECC